MTFAFIFESVGGTEWFVLLGVILIVVGPKNLPSAARKLGQIMSTLRRAADEFKRQLMSMDQEVRNTVNDAVKTDYVETPKDPAAAEAESHPEEPVQYDESGNPYPEGSPYPGHEEYYDATQYDYPNGGDDASSADVPQPATESTDSAAAEPAQPKQPTDEELRAIKITVSSAPGKKA